ncbi:unnamed protein product [Chrysoparadoxa australica]
MVISANSVFSWCTGHAYSSPCSSVSSSCSANPTPRPSPCSTSSSCRPEVEPSHSCLEELLGDTLLNKRERTGISNTTETISGCRFVALYVSSRRSASSISFLPVLRSFYLHALHESRNEFELIGVCVDRSEPEFEVNFYSIAVCWPAVIYEKAKELADILQSSLGLKHLPSLVVIDTMTGKVVTAKGVMPVIAAMKSEEPSRAVRDLLGRWGMETREKVAEEKRVCQLKRRRRRRRQSLLGGVKRAVMGRCGLFKALMERV